LIVIFNEFTDQFLFFHWFSLLPTRTNELQLVEAVIPSGPPCCVDVDVARYALSASL
jgi:hypothetical protein